MPRRKGPTSRPKIPSDTAATDVVDKLLDTYEHLSEAMSSLEDARSASSLSDKPQIPDSHWVELVDKLYDVGEEITFALSEFDVDLEP